MPDPEPTAEIGRLPLHEDVVHVSSHRRVSGRVRVTVTTAEEDASVEGVQRRRHAEIERVPIGREVEAPPPVRREGDVVVIPVLEERLVLVRRLVLTEEIRLHLRTEEDAVILPASRRVQSVVVHRTAVAEGDQDFSLTSSEKGPFQMQRTLIAMFDSRADADRAAEALRGLNVQVSNVQVHDSASTSGGAVDSRLGFTAEGSSWMPQEDRAIYHEGLRRGGAAVTAQVAEGDLQLAMDAMEAAGAVDLDTREAEWRSQGWTGGSMAGFEASSENNPPGTMASRAADKVAGTNISGAHPENETRGTTSTGVTSAGMTDASATGASAGVASGTAAGLTGGEERIPLAEERLRVGKREAHGGRVRVRSYVVETPVEEQVRLREEHVRVERVEADRAATGSEAELFRERTIEAEESVEEPVVSKEVRVTGEVVVSKDSTERTETIRDTVRRTEVDVDEDAAANDRERGQGKGVA